jgi:hypothetical protein
MLSPQQAQVKISLMESAVLMAHIYSPAIPAGSKSEDAEGIVATQVERWYQWLLQAYKDETVFHSPDAPSGVAPVQGTALVQALISAIPGLDPATKALLGGVVAPLLTQGAAAVVQAAKGAIPMPPSSTSP